MKSFLKYWVPVFIVMALIFLGSSDRQSAQHSSRIVGPILRWLFPDLSLDALDKGIFAIRKCAHLAEYAVLGLLAWRAFHKPDSNNLRPWEWPDATRAMAVVVLYATSDELHQLFVPTRQASVVDVLIDTTGAILALGLLWLWGRFTNRWS